MINLSNIELSLLEESNSPYYFANVYSYDIEYINNSMCNLLHKEMEDCVGEKCYKVIFNLTKPCKNCLNKNIDLQPQEILDGKPITFYKNFHHVDYQCKNRIVQYQKSKLNMGKFIDIGASKYSREFKNTMKTCIDLFKENDVKETIQKLLQIATEYYKGNKGFIFEVSEDKKSYNYAYQYYTNATDEINHDNTKLPLFDVKSWLRIFDRTGHIDIENIEILDKNSIEYEQLNQHGVQSLIAIPIKNDLDLLGFILIENPNKEKGDRFILYTIAMYIQENMYKKKVNELMDNEHAIDTLTQLKNRLGYNQKLSELETDPPQQLGIVYCDINGLRKVNAIYGYEHGDFVISQASKIMQSHFTQDFYRIGGDEFICFVENINEEDFYVLVSKLREETQTNSKACFSVGCTWREGKSISINQISDAHSLMYINKQKYYQNALNGSEDRSVAILDDLIFAVKNNEFKVYLQPKVDLNTNEVVGAEALVRRFDITENKLIFPDQFIPMYENESIIRHVDLEVLRQVCIFQKSCIDQGKTIKISVNFSRVTLLEDDIVKTIIEICSEYKVPHKLLMIEITERIGKLTDEQGQVSNSLIHEFMKNGFSLSLDDFGCAYSNIVTLANIDVDEVKVDKSLVDYLEDSKKNQIIVRNIIDMCNEMEQSTVSEGIETKSQADLLKKFKCTHGQGYYFCRPIPTKEFFEKYII